MATLTLFHTDTNVTYFSATSGSVTVPATVQDGDMLVLCWYTRSTPTIPSGWTDHGSYDNGSIGQRTGIATKVAVASTDASATVTLTQASNARMGLHLSVYRSDTGTMEFSKVSGSDYTGKENVNEISPPPLSEAVDFVAVSAVSNDYASLSEGATGLSNHPFLDSKTDAAWIKLDTGEVQQSRMSAAYAIFNNQTTSTLVWNTDQTSSSNVNLSTAMVTLVPAGAGDVTAPVLTLPTGTTTGATTASGTVTTDEANGTLYAVVTASATPPSAADIRAGTGAAYSTSQAVSATGVQNVSATGLTAETTYYWHFLHDDAAANASNIVTSASFTTDAAVVVVKGVRVRLYDDADAAAASITSIQCAWFDQPEPKDFLAPELVTSTASTDVDGWLEFNIDAATSLAVGADGFLIAYKLDATDAQDSQVFAGRLTVEDIA